jgi:serine/threonine protein kinase
MNSSSSSSTSEEDDETEEESHTTTDTTTTLGIGSFGKVERVYRNGQWYARKTMIPQDQDEGIGFSTLRECDIYSRVTSPFMPRVFRISLEDHSVRLWMGLADLSLAQYLELEEPSFRERVSVSLQLLWTGLNFLHHIHAYGILHRDIKPDNILLKKGGGGSHWLIYISDMGSCRWVAEKRLKLTSGMGTRCYRAPEMESHQYGKASEVYGLGVTVIQCIHGHHPLSNIHFNPITVPQDWHHTLVSYREYLSTPLFDLLLFMTSSKPQERITVRDALQSCLFQDAVIPSIPKMTMIPLPLNYTRKLIPAFSLDDRKTWVDFLVDLGYNWRCHNFTIAHSVHLLDDFLLASSTSMIKNHYSLLKASPFELYSCVTIWICSKYFEILAISLADLLSQCQDRFTKQDFIDMEEYMIQLVQFRIVRRPPGRGICGKTSIEDMKTILGSAEYLYGKEISVRSSSRRSSQR